MGSEAKYIKLDGALDIYQNWRRCGKRQESRDDNLRFAESVNGREKNETSE